jgi:CHAT domain-containing protein
VGTFWRACSVGVAGGEADELGALLLDPVAGMVGASRRLVIVPFGPLATVPFHALPFAGAPLGHERVISFLPAASHLAGRRLDEPIDEGSAVLAVGDPAFDPAAQPSLRRLPGAAVEARTVGELWGSEEDVLVDTDASESELLKRLAGRAIVHLAAHGHLDEIAPSTSALVLAGADRLTVSDLIGLRLDAELAVLSACDSGRGAVTLGGDVIGLTRGLLASGVRRALVSLWPVDDVAACATMVAFHERLRETGVPAQALADAQAAVRALSGAELAAHYTAVSGEEAPPTHTVRRGGGTPVAATVRRGIPLDPSFVDADEPEAQPVAALDGSMERVWAPFVLVGG